jgi:ABC-type antimicrobial peptide transport system permease subunit
VDGRQAGHGAGRRRDRVGLAGAFVLGQVFEGLLFGVTPGDAVTYATTAGFIGCAALAASMVPALRAARIDPTRALRAE